MSIIKYSLYLRIFIEAHESMLISATSEIDSLEFPGTSEYFSFVIAWAVFGISILLPITGFYYFWTKRNNYDPKKKFFFMEFFVDLRNRRYARLYLPVLLLRRIIFV